MENTFKISGFTCGSCVLLAQKRIEKIEGVNKAEVSITGEANIFSNRPIDKDEIKKVLEDTHYSVQGE